MNTDEILKLLDEELVMDPQHDPPYLYQLWTHCYPADARMTVFRSDKHWAVVFEFISYWCRWQGVQNDIWCYGDCVREHGQRYEDQPLELPAENDDTPFGAGYPMNPYQFSVKRNGERLDFTPSPEEYAAAGIGFAPERPDPNAHQEAQIVRYLCHHFNHSFFTSEEELRDILTEVWDETQSPPSEPMALFLQTRHWNHPNIGLDEHPSQTISFPILARAIASGDLTEWAAQDPATFNTDWRVYDLAEKTEQDQMKAQAAEQEQAWASLPSEVQDEFRRQGLYGVGFIQIQEASEDDGADQ